MHLSSRGRQARQERSPGHARKRRHATLVRSTLCVCVHVWGCRGTSRTHAQAHPHLFAHQHARSRANRPKSRSKHRFIMTLLITNFQLHPSLRAKVCQPCANVPTLQKRSPRFGPQERCRPSQNYNSTFVNRERCLHINLQLYASCVCSVKLSWCGRARMLEHNLTW